MQQGNKKNINATAFISCSLRQEDEEFVNWIIAILKKFRIQSNGTVGKFSAAPSSTAELMRKNIPLSDILVVVATPRYFQQDISLKTTTKAMSEMLHVECGMAYMLQKPIVVFVRKGTTIGNFIPSVTQYITLDGSLNDLKAKWTLIGELLRSACMGAHQSKEKANTEAVGDFFTKGLLFWGGVKLIESLGSDG